MKLKTKKIYNKLYFPSLYSLIILLLALNLISVFGKEKSFLLINQFHNSYFDSFFSYITNLGDGLIWIPLLLFTLIFHRKKWLIVVINLIFSTKCKLNPSVAKYAGLKTFGKTNVFKIIANVVEKIKLITTINHFFL